MVSFSRLRTFHAYLESFQTIWDRCTASPLCEDQLLLCMIIYLSSLPLAPELPVTKLRAYLRPRITCFRDRVLLHTPISFTTLQALELVSVHAPLGVVPLQLTDPRIVTVARGQIAALRFISSQVKFATFFQAIAEREGDNLWNQPDCLLYFYTTALDAGMALEDEAPHAPAALAEVRELAAQYLGESREYLWRNGQESIGAAGLVGRLGVFDRLCRLGEVIDSLDRLRKTIDTAAMDGEFNAVDAISDEFTLFAQKMDKCDQRHEAILGELQYCSPRYQADTQRSLRPSLATWNAAT